MKIHQFAILLLILGSFAGSAQYPPPAGMPGSTAIHKDSAIFMEWASMCSASRGFRNISIPDSGFADHGVPENALGKADGLTVSLGDGGSALCTLSTPVMNGPGFDFAVFENGFSDAYLELAFVEVSTNGESFFRFPCHSLTQTQTQTGPFGELDTEKINNLAGKYRLGYGTPFDLKELAGIPELDVDSITYIRIIDVVGSLNPEYATFDSAGNMVNDPWPTLFPSSGFDLDAVGLINLKPSSVPDSEMKQTVTFFVRQNELKIESKRPVEGDLILFSANGQVVYREENVISPAHINISAISNGLYIAVFSEHSGTTYQSKLIR